MKALVVGTGSVGLRHISNLSALGVEVTAFSYRSSSGKPASSMPAGVRLTANLPEALESDVDLVVIANRNDQHMEVALSAARRGKALFIEKPLSVSLAGADQLVALERDMGLVIEAGYTLRCHPNVIWIQEFLSRGMLGDVMHARASVGQWLPDWRPQVDYTENYAAFRRTGGGVLFDLVHEIDLVNWLVGPVVLVTAMHRHVSALKIETEAIAQLGFRCESGALAQVHMDYVRKGYARTFELIGSNGTVTWDYALGTVTWDRGVSPLEEVHSAAEFQRNDMFMEHMRHFLRRVQDPVIKAASPLADSVSTLRIALACHLSNAELRHVRPGDLSVDYSPL